MLTNLLGVAQRAARSERRTAKCAKNELVVAGTSIALGGGMTRQPENHERPSVPAEKPAHLRVRSGLKAGLAIDGECKESNHNKGG